MLQFDDAPFAARVLLFDMPELPGLPWPYDPRSRRKTKTENDGCRTNNVENPFQVMFLTLNPAGAGRLNAPKVGFACFPHIPAAVKQYANWVNGQRQMPSG